MGRYKKHSFTGLYHYIQLFVVSNGVDTKYFANSDKEWMHSLAFFWTDFDNVRITNLKDFSLNFLARDHIIKMFTRYMILNDTDKNLMVMRPYQVYAVEALVRQATLTNRNAYIWHTTGAGKTLTSFKTAQILAANPNIKKVIFLVDRKDLDSQTTEEFNKFESGSVDATDRTNILVKQMQDKNKQLIVTTIQKMANAVKRPQYARIMDAYKDEKVVFIVDECHRSQFGDMHKDIVRHFQKAQFFGFTGTPRFPENGKVEGKITQTTEMLFGECLHNYLIKDAIFDNNVLGFHVEYINTLKGDFDWDDPTTADAIDVGELYLSEERMSLIANHIVQNHKSKTRNGQYTAIFAVSSIEALIKYYDIFKQIKHDLNIAGIFSFGQNEESEGKDEHSRDALERIIDDYNGMYNTNFSTDTFSAYHKDISDRVKGKKTKPLDILIVVNMFLTGFDSKPLQVLYVDKDLKYHDLLQAYSRTNRVEKETKQFGNIVCYRNLKRKTDDALRLFSGGGDISEILLKDYDYYLDKSKQLISELYKVVSCPEDIDNIQSEEEQAKFVIAFRELSKMLLVLETFVDFTWDDLDQVMTQQEYENFKSRYFTIHDNLKNNRDAEKVSILDDIDFSIEIIQTDKINVTYIMNLLKNMERKDKKQREKDIQHIYDELDRTDNPELKKKVELIKRFIGDVLVGLPDDASVEEAYVDFEDKERNEEIEAFAKEKDIDADEIKQIISEYEFSHTLTKDMIKEQIPMALPFRERRALVQAIIDFITQNCDKYQ